MIYLIFSLAYFLFFGTIISARINDKTFFGILYIAIVGFWGLSYTYAPDLIGYMKYFYNEVRTIDQGIDLQVHKFEPGFNLIASLCKSIWPQYIFFQYVIFASEMFFVLEGIRKILTGKQARFVAVLLFFVYPCMLSATRQGIAVALIIYAVSFIKDNCYWKYFGLILIAYFFHHSSAMAIPLYFIRYIDERKNYKYVALGILLVADVFWLTGFSLADKLDNLLGFFISDADGLDRYSIYMNKTETSVSNFGIAKIIEINVAYCSFLLYTRIEDGNELKVLMVLYTMIGLMLGGILAHRFLYYFIIFYYIGVYIGLNALITMKKDSDIALVSYTCIALYMSWFYLLKSNLIEQEYIFCP